MKLNLAIRHELGAFALDAAFAVADSHVVALFGPSGSGKTSIINTIAGLIRPAHGRVEVDGTVLVDTARGVWLPPHRRRVGYIFQDARLLPHLTVRQNLLYGRWFAPRSGPRTSLEGVTELLGIAHLLERRPALLSGGETQRVAIGRALLAEPRLLLMDEPLASLDENRKREILPYLERLRSERRIPIVLVSHSVAEVARLADTVVVLEQGRVRLAGPAEAVLARLEQVRLAEDANGISRVEARILAHDIEFDLTELESRAGRWRVPRLDLAPPATLTLLIDPTDVILATAPPEGTSALNCFRGTVSRIETGGAAARVAVDCSGDAINARVTRLSAQALGLEVGRPVFLLIKSVSLTRRAAG